jgi:succinate dehydrogenase (ubiquinone) membrane anchor subunit
MASLGLVGGAAVVSSPMATGLLNLGLGIVLPLHLHLGFGAIITDYLPQRKFPLLYRASRSLLYAGTALTLYGLYRFNTEDIGIIEGVKALWHAKRDKEDEEEKRNSQ